MKRNELQGCAFESRRRRPTIVEEVAEQHGTSAGAATACVARSGQVRRGYRTRSKMISLPRGGHTGWIGGLMLRIIALLTMVFAGCGSSEEPLSYSAPVTINLEATAPDIAGAAVVAFKVITTEIGNPYRVFV